MEPFGQMIGADAAMICCNGTHVVDAEGREIYAFTLVHEILEQALEYAAPRDIHVNAYTRDELLFLTHTPWADEYARRVKTLAPRYATLEETRGLELLKVSLVDSPAEVQRHIREFVPTLDPAIVRPTESEPEYLELMHPDANKGRGLAAVCERLGIAREQTAALGDYLNDLEMIRWAGVGGAVGNAAAVVRDSADIVTPTNDEGAVSWFIDWLLRNGEH